MKIGDTVTMLFHCAGVASEEEYKIIKKRGNIVTLDTDEEDDKCFKFDVQTGRCLNDSTMFGVYRTLK